MILTLFLTKLELLYINKKYFNIIKILYKSYLVLLLLSINSLILYRGVEQPGSSSGS